MAENDQKPNGLDSDRILKAIENLGTKLGARIDGTNETVASLSTQVASLGVRIDTVGANLGARIDRTDKKIDTLGANLGARIDRTNERIDTLAADIVKTAARQETRLDEIVKNTGSHYVALKGRVEALETKVFGK